MTSVNDGTTNPTGRGRIFRLYKNLHIPLIGNMDTENLVSKWESWKDVSKAELDYGEKQAAPALTHLMGFYRNQNLRCCKTTRLPLQLQNISLEPGETLLWVKLCWLMKVTCQDNSPVWGAKYLPLS